ncbi:MULTISPECIES: RNA polymerase sigma factor [Methylomonas]|uniref:RNA polymerase subunit sigma-24 n=1 Tax=Methylomonas koyamae TaxID=702114 RepID=A0A177N1P3_9GAMM|nr:sigma-70 family RNA polymerase sigma factor [Methylomonas koyamae]OAI11866.1 RNA polymerase subunit sigma-24 [Methylomonas koyamae]
MTAITLHQQQIVELFRDHRDTVVAYLLQRVNCPDTAQDLSQETYLRLLRKHELSHDENLTGYLFRTAERLAIDFVRQNRRREMRETIIDETVPCPAKQPDESAMLGQQCQRLLQAIAGLPGQCRHIFLLRKFDELSYHDIAKQLGISEKTVQRQLVKAMLRCHQALLETG